MRWDNCLHCRDFWHHHQSLMGFLGTWVCTQTLQVYEEFSLGYFWGTQHVSTTGTRLKINYFTSQKIPAWGAVLSKNTDILGEGLGATWLIRYSQYFSLNQQLQIVVLQSLCFETLTCRRTKKHDTDQLTTLLWRCHCSKRRKQGTEENSRFLKN